MNVIKCELIELLENHGLEISNEATCIESSVDIWLEELTSLEFVEIIVDIEEHFNIEIPDNLLNRDIICSVDRLSIIITELKHNSSL